MDWQFAAWLLLGGSTLLLFLGLPVAFTFLAVNLVGAALWMGGEAGLAQLARNAVSSVASFALTPIPLFVLMGEVLFHTGLDAADLLRRYRPQGQRRTAQASSYEKMIVSGLKNHYTLKEPCSPK